MAAFTFAINSKPVRYSYISFSQLIIHGVPNLSTNI